MHDRRSSSTYYTDSDNDMAQDCRQPTVACLQRSSTFFTKLQHDDEAMFQKAAFDFQAASSFSLQTPLDTATLRDTKTTDRIWPRSELEIRLNLPYLHQSSCPEDKNHHAAVEHSARSGYCRPSRREVSSGLLSRRSPALQWHSNDRKWKTSLHLATSLSIHRKFVCATTPASLSGRIWETVSWDTAASKRTRWRIRFAGP